MPKHAQIEIENVNISDHELLITAQDIKRLIPLSGLAMATILQGREQLRAILDHRDPRLFIIVGPCSIHDVNAAMGYARRLKTVAEEIQDTIMVVMRVYFEKPRTTTGWKGLINDPHLNGTFMIEEGLKEARKLLLAIAEMGLPTATEALDPVNVQYLSDLISWYAIGARTAESQTHREIASGLSTPVGFKNGTDGNLDIAINGLLSAMSPQHFLGIDSQSRCVIKATRGNSHGHLVLRGSGDRSNYDSESIRKSERQLAANELPCNIVIDCSHGNSKSDPAMQPLVMRDCVNQIVGGNDSIVGMMLESNLNAGNQSISSDLRELKYGVSITDECIDWPTTEHILYETHEKIGPVLAQRV